MALKLPAHLLFTVTAMFFSFKGTGRLVPVIVEGTVVSSQSGGPVGGAHVYVIKGEEESLTNSDGVYRITTWQTLPVIITIEHKNYKTDTITIEEASKKQLIRLEQKTN